MATQNLTEKLSSLTEEQQKCVLQFIDFLKRNESVPSPFLAAADQFIAEHPELLRRLAQ